MIRRKSLDEEDENPDRWLVSYADFITLLFAFFVVMYAISSVNQGKYNQLTSSIGTAFSGDPANADQRNNLKGGDGLLRGQQQSFIKPLPLAHKYKEKLRRERENMTNMGLDLSKTLAPLISEGKVRVVQNNRGIRIDIHDSLLFQPGSADLSGGQEILAEIAGVIASSDKLIQVEGHTDNVPIHNAAFYSNWELSAVRASSVVRMLSEDGIADQRLSAMGLGSAQPVSENVTALGRAKNRRVAIMILYDTPESDASGSEMHAAN